MINNNNNPATINEAKLEATYCKNSAIVSLEQSTTQSRRGANVKLDKRFNRGAMASSIGSEQR